MFSPVKLTLYIRSNSAESGPPLGTTLGNIGVNTIKFCKEFNEFTKELPNYFLSKVTINVEINRSFTFFVNFPPLGFLIQLSKQEENIKDLNGVVTIIEYLFLEDLLKIAKFIFPTYDLKKSIKIIKGTLYSSNIKIKL